MKSLATLLIFCATAGAAPTVTFVHAAAGSYGVQKAGEDAGPLYAFLKVESDKPDTLTFKDLVVISSGTKTSRGCAKLVKPPTIASIPEIKSTKGLLRLDADKGSPFKGKLAKGTTWLRIDAVMDHQCKVNDKKEPEVMITFDSGATPIDVTRALDEHLPS